MNEGAFGAQKGVGREGHAYSLRFHLGVSGSW